MRTLTFSLVVLSFVMVGAASCSSDDSGTTPPATGGSAGSAGTAGAAGTGGAAGTAGAAGTGGAAGQGPDGGTNQCTNAADMAAVQATYTVDGGSASVPDIAAICGKGCLGSADAVKCTTECIRLNTANAVSEGCADCFSASVKCTIDNCLSACFADPASAGCVACRCGDNTDKINCFDAYTACSGIPSTGCTPADGGTPEAGGDAAAD